MMIRLGLAIVGACLASFSTARAESAAERAASLVADVCLGPATPAKVLAAGEAAARKFSWTLNGKLSGSQHGQLSAAENAKPVAVVWRKKVWNFVGRDGGSGSLSIQIVASGPPGQRFDSCQVAVPGDIAGEVESEMSRRVALGPKVPLTADASGWVVSGATARPDQGFQILGISAQDLPAAKHPGPCSAPCQPGQPQRITAIGVLDYMTPATRPRDASVP